MSILDELNKQADVIKSEQSAEKLLQAQQEAFYRSDILPKLEYIYSWLFELTENLNLIKPDTKAQYNIEYYGELPVLQQDGYRISVDSRLDMKKIALTFECFAEGKITQGIEGKRNIEQYVEYLRGTKLTFDRRDQVNNASEETETEFDIELRVPVTFGFIANIESGCIDMSIRNFDQFGLRKIQIKPCDVTEDFMDKVGRYLIREREDFYKLDISEDEREQIRIRLHAEQEQHSRELHEQEERERVEKNQNEANRPGLLNSLKHLARNK